MPDKKIVPHIQHGTGHSTGHIHTEQCSDQQHTHMGVTSHFVRDHIPGLQRHQMGGVDGLAPDVKTGFFNHSK